MTNLKLCYYYFMLFLRTQTLTSFQVCALLRKQIVEIIQSIKDLNKKTGFERKGLLYCHLLSETAFTVQAHLILVKDLV